MANSAFQLTLVLLFIVAVGRSTPIQDQDRREDRDEEDKTFILRNHDEKDIVRNQRQEKRDRVDGSRDQDHWPERNSRRHQNNNRPDQLDGRRDQDHWPEGISRRHQNNNRRDQVDGRRQDDWPDWTSTRHQNNNRRDRERQYDYEREGNQDPTVREENRRLRNQDQRDQQDRRRQQGGSAVHDSVEKHRLRYQNDYRKSIKRVRRPSLQEVLLLGVHKASSEEENLQRQNNDVLELRDQVIVYDDGKLYRSNNDNDRLEVVRKGQDETNKKDEIIDVKAQRERRDVQDFTRSDIKREGSNQSQNSENKHTKHIVNSICSKEKPMSSFYSTKIHSHKDELHPDNPYNQQLYNGIIKNIQLQAEHNTPYSYDYFNPLTSVDNKGIHYHNYQPLNQYDKGISHGVINNINAFRQLQADNNTPYSYEYFHPVTSIYNAGNNSHNYQPVYHYDGGISHGIANNRNAFEPLRADNNNTQYPYPYEYFHPETSIYIEGINSHNYKPVYQQNQGISHGIDNNRNDQNPIANYH